MGGRIDVAFKFLAPHKYVTGYPKRKSGTPRSNTYLQHLLIDPPTATSIFRSFLTHSDVTNEIRGGSRNRNIDSGQTTAPSTQDRHNDINCTSPSRAVPSIRPFVYFFSPRRRRRPWIDDN